MTDTVIMSSSSSRRSLTQPSTSAGPVTARVRPDNEESLVFSVLSRTVCTIADLNPYRNVWAIKGRVTAKSPIKTWSNQRGEGKLFSFDLADETSEIRVAAFRAECDKFFDLIEIGNVYLVSKATVKNADKKFTHLNNDYELALNSESIILRGDNNDSDCPKMTYNFVKFKDLVGQSADTIVDIVGVCSSVGELETVTQRTSGREVRKRDISLVDDTETEVTLTIWGNQAEQNLATEGSAVVVKKVKVSDFNGKSLSCTQSSFVQVDPELIAAYGIKGWYERRRDTLRPQLLSPRKSGRNATLQWKNLCEINLPAVRSENGSLNCNSVATVTESRLRSYVSCSTPGCKKKVTLVSNECYKCDKCDKIVPNCQPRIILNLVIKDWGEDKSISVFQEDAEKMLGVSASQLLDIKEVDADRYKAIIDSLNFKKFNFRLRAVEDNYNGEGGVKITAYAVHPISSRDYGRILVEHLNSLSG